MAADQVAGLGDHGWRDDQWSPGGRQPADAGGVARVLTVREGRRRRRCRRRSWSVGLPAEALQHLVGWQRRPAAVSHERRIRLQVLRWVTDLRMARARLGLCPRIGPHSLSCRLCPGHVGWLMEAWRRKGKERSPARRRAGSGFPDHVKLRGEGADSLARLVTGGHAYLGPRARGSVRLPSTAARPARRRRAAGWPVRLGEQATRELALVQVGRLLPGGEQQHQDAVVDWKVVLLARRGGFVDEPFDAGPGWHAAQQSQPGGLSVAEHHSIAEPLLGQGEAPQHGPERTGSCCSRRANPWEAVVRSTYWQVRV